MSKSSHRKRKTPKQVLALPDLEHAKAAVLNGRRLLETATGETLPCIRNHAMLAVLIGCGLRRGGGRPAEPFNDFAVRQV